LVVVLARGGRFKDDKDELRTQLSEVLRVEPDQIQFRQVASAHLPAHVVKVKISESVLPIGEQDIERLLRNRIPKYASWFKVIIRRQPSIIRTDSGRPPAHRRAPVQMGR
jgi:hypothetical protein